MTEKLITIKAAAKELGVSVNTLRRWDKSGKLLAIRKKRGGYRFYRKSDLEQFSLDIFNLAKEWVDEAKGKEPSEKYYCENSAVFQTELMRLEKRLSEIERLKRIFSLIVAVSGEIGNNSFDHNLGNWPDVAGVFFGYDLNKGYIVLADRGQGVWRTLRRIRPDLKNDNDALVVAFSEVVSGRSPEERGNGLKFVRQVIIENNFSLFFQTGFAELNLKKGDEKLNITNSNVKVNGCLVLIKF